MLAAFVTPMRNALSELALPHSITSPARASTVPGIARPRDLAVPRLTTNSTLIFQRTRQQPHAIESEKFNSMLPESPPDWIQILHLHCECIVNSLAS